MELQEPHENSAVELSAGSLQEEPRAWGGRGTPGGSGGGVRSSSSPD